MDQKIAHPRPTADAFSMDDFAKALAGYDYEFKKGQVVVGKAVSYESDGALIDIGAKSVAFLPAQEASLQGVKDVSMVLPLDEEREFLIIREQDADGQLTLSLRQLEVKKVWDKMADLQESNQSVSVRVMGINKGGVTVNVQGLRGFIPRSHLLERDDLQSLVGTSLTASILDLKPDQNKLVLSNRLATRSAAFSQLEIGQLVEGKISGVKPFGVFVDLEGTGGLLHINQISNKYVESLPTLFQVGQVIKAMIVNLDEDKGRISLSTKVLENFPGEMLEKPADVMAEADDRQERARKAVLGN
jgi:small subunit ribosomal protein S1